MENVWLTRTIQQEKTRRSAIDEFRRAAKPLLASIEDGITSAARHVLDEFPDMRLEVHRADPDTIVVQSLTARSEAKGQLSLDVTQRSLRYFFAQNVAADVTLLLTVTNGVVEVIAPKRPTPEELAYVLWGPIFFPHIPMHRNSDTAPVA